MLKRFWPLLLAGALMLSVAGCGEPQNALDGVTVDQINDFEEVTVSASAEDGIYTIFQHNDAFNGTIAVSADGVMVFGSGYQYLANQIRDWTNRGYQSVGVMVPMGRDHGSYYIRGEWDGKEHPEIIATTTSGAYKTHPTAGDGHTTYYVLPSADYAEFVADYCIQGIEAGADSVYIEEPDGWIDSFYNQTFLDRWKQEYGTDYDLSMNDTQEGIAKQDYIIAQLFLEAYDIASTRIKEQYPNVKVFICTHSVSNYLLHGISTDNYSIVDLPNIDGVVAQAWSDTSLAASFPLNGTNGVHAFEYSYMEYSEMLNYVRANGKQVYTLSDPQSDNASINGPENEPLLRSVYTENVIAQLINPENKSFELLPWPTRAFVNVSHDYKGLQETVFRLMNQAHEVDAIGYAGTEGIAVMTSSTAISNLHDGTGRSTTTTYALTGLATSLITRGVPVDMLTLEGVNQPGYLDGVNTLILSYDFMKPLYESYNKAISDWVKKGGSLIVVSGTSVNMNVEGWWSDRFQSAEAALFAELGMEVKSYSQLIERPTLERAGSAAYLPQSVKVGRGYAVTGFDVGGGANVLYRGDGKAVVFEQDIGSGHVIVAGVSPSYFGSGETTYELLEGLVIRALAFRGVEYHAPQMMYTVRGEIEIYKTFNRTYTLSGTFVDLTSDTYEVIKNPTLEPYSYGLYCRIGSEGLVFANARYTDDFNQGANSVSYTACNMLNSKAQAVLYLPGITGTPSIKVVTQYGDDITAESGAVVTQSGDTLYLTYRHPFKYTQSLWNKGSYEVTVTINW